jgi:hypothetical protein
VIYLLICRVPAYNKEILNPRVEMRVQAIGILREMPVASRDDFGD